MPTDIDYKLQILSKAPALGLHTQTHLLSLMNHLGYPINEAGVCHGYALMAIQAAQSGDLETFHERIRYILSERNEIYKAVASLKKKLELNIPFKQLSLTPSEKKLLEMKSFFDGIELYHRPQERKDVFAESIEQRNTEKVIPIISSRVIDQQGGLIKKEGWIGVYKLEDMQRYIDALDRIASSSNVGLTFYLSNVHHAISLIYNPANKSWLIEDANNLLISEVPKDSLSEIIMQMFFVENLNTEAVAFQTIPYASGNQDKSSELLAKLKLDSDFVDVHQINAYRGSLTTNTKQTLAWLAAFSGKYIEYREIVAVGGNVVLEDNVSHWSPELVYKDTVRTELSKDETPIHFLKKSLLDVTSDIREQISVKTDKLTFIYNLLPDEAKYQFLIYLAIGYFDVRIVDSQDLDMFGLFPDNLRKIFLDRITDEALSVLIKKPNDLLSIFRVLPVEKQNSLLNHLGQERLIELLPTAIYLRDFYNLLSQEKQNQFLDSVTNQQLLNYITRSHDLIIILKLLPYARQNDFLSYIEVNQIPNLQPDYEVIIKPDENNKRIERFSELNKLIKDKTSDERKALLDELVDGQLYDIVKDFKKFPEGSSIYRRKDAPDFPRGSEEVFFDEMLSGKFSHLLINKSAIFSDPSIVAAILDSPIAPDIQDHLISRASNLEILKNAKVDPDIVIKNDLALKNTSDEEFISLFTDKLKMYSYLRLLPTARRTSIFEKMDFAKIYSFISDIWDLKDIIPFLPEAKRHLSIEKFGIENIVSSPDFRSNFATLFRYSSVAQKEQLITQMSNDDIAKLSPNFEAVYKLLPQLPVAAVEVFFEKLGNEKLFELLSDSIAITLLLPYLSDQLLTKTLDRTYELLVSNQMQDSAGLLPYLRQRHSERVNPNRGAITFSIIQQLKIYLNFIIDHSSTVDDGHPHTFFSANTKKDLSQIQQLIDELDKTNDLSYAVKLITTSLNKLDPSLASLFTKLAFADGGSIYFPHAGLLTLSSEELKQYRDYEIRPIKPEILNPKEILKILDATETLPDTINKLENLVAMALEEQESYSSKNKNHILCQNQIK